MVGLFGRAGQRRWLPTQQAQQTPPKPLDAANVGGALAAVLALAAVAPFLELGSNLMGGLLSIVIIFFGLRQAWTITGRKDLVVTGPYTVTEAGSI